LVSSVQRFIDLIRNRSLAEQATRQPSLAEQATRRFSLAEQVTRRFRLLLFCFTAVCAGIGGYAHGDEAYIWQRQWTGELSRTLNDQKPQFTRYRILAAQHISGDQWVEPQVDLAALKTAALPVVIVLRLPGAAPLLTPTVLASKIASIRTRWQAGGITVMRVEIDFDCAQAQLAQYRQQLLGLRALLDKALSLDITALPAWLKTAELPALLAVTDRVTLQVHSVLAPKRGLFDPRLAEFWIRQFALLSSKPFSVALPAYGAKLLLDADGKVIGVEHEAELGTPHAAELELQASPESVRTLIDALALRPVANLESSVWFRLPLPSDARAWAPVTLASVINKQTLRAKIQPIFQVNAAGGVDVRLRSLGNLTAVSALRIAVNAKCSGDGVGGYTYLAGVFSAKQGVELKPGASRTIGWLRCPAGNVPEIIRPVK
jgi:hypothetical protein